MEGYALKLEVVRLYKADRTGEPYASLKILESDHPILPAGEKNFVGYPTKFVGIEDLKVGMIFTARLVKTKAILQGVKVIKGD
jgi:hypothetical protein